MENIREECYNEGKTTECNLEDKTLYDHCRCEKCDEEFLFKMQDEIHEFFLGMSTILECLLIAQEEKAVPALPNEWWEAVCGRYM